MRHPPCWSPSDVKKARAGRDAIMVLCIVVGCGTKTGNKDGIGMFRIPSVVKNQGEQIEELTTTRREKWISAISRGDKNVLQSERVCGRHFVSGSPAKHWDKHNIDWFPTLSLGKKEYKERNSKMGQERANRAKARRKSAIERQEQEAAAKRKRVNENGTRITSLDFSENTVGTSDQYADAANVDMEPKDASLNFASETFESHQSENVASTSGISAETQTEAFDYTYRKTSTHELPDVDSETQTQAFDYLFRKSSDSRAPDRDAETQTEEFDYLIPERSGYRAPDREFFKADERVRFYTGLPSYEILNVTFQHVALHVNRRTQVLNKFQEFVMVLMKLRLNVPFQDLAYRFAVRVHKSYNKVKFIYLIRYQILTIYNLSKYGGHPGEFVFG